MNITERDVIYVATIIGSVLSSLGWINKNYVSREKLDGHMATMSVTMEYMKSELTEVRKDMKWLILEVKKEGNQHA